jgi:hypothetical protein
VRRVKPEKAPIWQILTYQLDNDLRVNPNRIIAIQTRPRYEAIVGIAFQLVKDINKGCLQPRSYTAKDSISQFGTGTTFGLISVFYKMLELTEIQIEGFSAFICNMAESKG